MLIEQLKFRLERSNSLYWDKASSKKDVLEKLDSTYKKIKDYFSSLEDLCIEEANFLGGLLEHEIQHHGQLVRYIYGNKIEILQSWKDRYNFD